MSKLWLVRALVALVALALMLVPGEVWSAPQSDYEHSGFDQDLIYVDSYNRSLFDPLLVLENGTWDACPCEPGAALVVSGSGLAQSRAASADGAYELGGAQVLVNGRPAILHLVSPSQINFDLPADVTGPSASLVVLHGGAELARDAVAIGEKTSSGDVSIAESALRLAVTGGREPAVHLITTPLSFRASFSAMISEQSREATPLRVALWNPRNFAGFALVFTPEGEIDAEFVEDRGRVARVSTLGDWQTGETYDVQVQWERDERASISVTGPEGTVVDVLTAEEAPALFAAYRPSLSVAAVAHNGSSSASLTDYHVELLPGRFTTIRIDDPIVPLATAGLAALGLLLLLAAAAPLRALAAARRTAGRWAGSAREFVAAHPVATAALLLGGAVYLAGNAYLFTLGSQPFDMGSQARWAHITTVDGLADLYYASQVATLASVWNGMPYHEAVFPYNAGMSYYFWLIGQVHQLFFGHTDPESQSLQVMIKSFNLAFMIVDAPLVYALVRHVKPQARILPWAGAAMLLLNPAFIFDTAVWGETESVVLFPLLASSLAALKDRPGLAWSFLAAAFLSKETALLAVLVMGVYYLVHFSPRRNVESVSSALVLVLFAILPFTLSGYPPSVAIDPTLAALWVHGASGAEPIFQVVSYDAFNVWTLVTHFADGASGVERFRTPDVEARFAGLSYHEAGLLMLGATVLFLLAFVVLRRRRLAEHPETLFTLLAVVFLVEMFLPTRALSRYFIFAAVFAGLGMSGRTRWASLAAFAALTVTSFVGEYGSMALVIQDFPAHAPELAPQSNALSRLMADLFTSDVFLTVAVALNGASLLLLGSGMWLQSRAGRRSAAPEVAVPELETLRPALPSPAWPRPEPTWDL